MTTAVFDDRTDIYRARQLVNERLTEAVQTLPQGIPPPTMEPLIGATSLTLIVGLTSDTLSPMDLRTFADWTMRPRLLGVPGVARIGIFGGEVRQLQVQAIPGRLAAFHLSLSDIVAAARNATGVRGAGFIETPAQRVVLEAHGQALTPARLGQTVVATYSGRPVRLADLARLADAGEPRIGDSTIMGKPGILILVSAQYRANTIEVTSAIEKALDDLKPALAAARVRLYPDLFRPANFINAAIHNIGVSLLVGACLVAIVLMLFLMNMRVAVISLTAIPLSLLTSVILLDATGQSLNTLTLGGLAIAIGEVVDDAIIDAENIFRRLREAPRPLTGSQIFRLIRDASIEVRSAVVYATFVVAIVLVPVLAMRGLQGRLFAPLAWSYIFSILASLAVALTVTPALCYLLLPSALEHLSEPSYILRLKAGYRRLLQRLSRRTAWLMAGAALVSLAGFAAVPFLGGEFLPELREGHFIIHTTSLPGTSLEETGRLGSRITAELLRIPGVRLVAQQIGRTPQGDDTAGVNYSEIHVDLEAGHGDQETTETRLRDSTARFPGLSVSINSFLAERIQEVISGINADVVANIFGDNLGLLDAKAAEIAAILAETRGAADIRVESPPGEPEVAIRLRPESLVALGFQPLPVLEAIQTAYQGTVVGQIYDRNRVFNVGV
ncbi:MAG: efflux RND transporter permease subunit, partial [Pseudomonadota bacterium]